jgi:hypothetical protein
MTLDPHGQPYNIRFNRARRAERDLSEFLGLAKGLLGDGVISREEAALVSNWVVSHAAAAEQWPINHLVRRLATIFGGKQGHQMVMLEPARVGQTESVDVRRHLPRYLEEFRTLGEAVFGQFRISSASALVLAELDKRVNVARPARHLFGSLAASR